MAAHLHNCCIFFLPIYMRKIIKVQGVALWWNGMSQMYSIGKYCKNLHLQLQCVVKVHHNRSFSGWQPAVTQKTDSECNNQIYVICIQLQVNDIVMNVDGFFFVCFFHTWVVCVCHTAEFPFSYWVDVISSILVDVWVLINECKVYVFTLLSVSFSGYRSVSVQIYNYWADQRLFPGAQWGQIHRAQREGVHLPPHPQGTWEGKLTNTVEFYKL